MAETEKRRLGRWLVVGLALFLGLALLWITTPADPGPSALRTRFGIFVWFVAVPLLAVALLLGRFVTSTIALWVATASLAFLLNWWMLLLFFTRSFSCGPGASVCGSPHSARVVGIILVVVIWTAAVAVEARGLDRRARAQPAPPRATADAEAS